MKLTKDLGQKIIKETTKLINEHIIIVNENAIIIASTDSSRIGDFHEGALLTIKNNCTTVLTTEHVPKMQGIKPGVNLPITINDNVIGVIGITGNPDEIIPFASLMKKMTELLINESIYIQQKEWHRRAIEAYFFDWVQKKEISEEFSNRAEILGINLSPPLRCSIIEIKHVNNNLETIDQIIQLLSLKMDCIPIRWGDKRILFLTEDIKYNLSQLKIEMQSLQNYILTKLSIPLTIGIGTITNTYCIKESYENGVNALTIGEKDGINVYEDLLLEVCFSAIDKNISKDFISKVFRNLPFEEELFHTLRIYLINNMNVKKTSEELHIHINTLHYRLNRIETITGHNPRNAYSIAIFYIALYLLDKDTN
ncbi:CdaR family transcriptional regulator [Ornithinibacillus halotolerans]|uniref:Transcriptional regulator n=1 Tax=Ornithinibacillus halotolerans TaxID=1274357 RepID=A0A916WDB4_9BACI|nr:sugar diacid recognition domain-containing protein [Ornithinibacillus halotolerans]GGA87746.1 transcriptional regulator [Ornithinibacillus halotolerans]